MGECLSDRLPEVIFSLFIDCKHKLTFLMWFSLRIILSGIVVDTRSMVTEVLFLLDGFYRHEG